MARNFDVDFMILDLALTGIWVAVLVNQKHHKALAIGVLGIVLNFIIDYGIWYSITGIREIYEMPQWLPPIWFFLYFSITYGMIQYSFVAVMFTHGTNRKFWTVFLYGGWMLIGLVSQALPIEDTPISIARIMTTQRTTEVVTVVLEYSVLALLAYKGKFDLTKERLLYIFGVAVLTHFAMEITLLVPGIRNVSLLNLVVNSLVEWNMGAPVIYLILKAWESRRAPSITHVVLMGPVP